MGINFYKYLTIISKFNEKGRIMKCPKCNNGKITIPVYSIKCGPPGSYGLSRNCTGVKTVDCPHCEKGEISLYSWWKGKDVQSDRETVCLYSPDPDTDSSGSDWVYWDSRNTHWEEVAKFEPNTRMKEVE